MSNVSVRHHWAAQRAALWEQQGGRKINMAIIGNTLAWSERERCMPLAKAHSSSHLPFSLHPRPYTPLLFASSLLPPPFSLVLDLSYTSTGCISLFPSLSSDPLPSALFFSRCACLTRDLNLAFEVCFSFSLSFLFLHITRFASHSTEVFHFALSGRFFPCGRPTDPLGFSTVESEILLPHVDFYIPSPLCLI